MRDDDAARGRLGLKPGRKRSVHDPTILLRELNRGDGRVIDSRGALDDGRSDLERRDVGLERSCRWKEQEGEPSPRVGSTGGKISQKSSKE